MKTRKERKRGKVSDVFLISVDRGQRTALERSFESQCRTNMEDAGASGLPASADSAVHPISLNIKNKSYDRNQN
ncbi:hypothetical protein MESMUL_00040 [Mesosutterella multiformis]|uniref:Uncharacterized protein n=1 Tax=Mesosutterella multiformis TaxID=2259133 RepID=A0A388SB55_9BURK|nr:hypothetical protein MESMUL_00040 [Mesosutterella multiformis]